MIVVGKGRLEELWEVREELYGRVVDVATRRLGLPRDAGELVAAKGGMRRRLGYFRLGFVVMANDSVKRRKKKDWNEVLRLYDVTDYVE
jgi:glycerol-3-phosphate O-acyltransferase/dihydroxyacetone phosphate acyltransferase